MRNNSKTKAETLRWSPSFRDSWRMPGSSTRSWAPGHGMSGAPSIYEPQILFENFNSVEVYEINNGNVSWKWASQACFDRHCVRRGPCQCWSPPSPQCTRSPWPGSWGTEVQSFFWKWKVCKSILNRWKTLIPGNGFLTCDCPDHDVSIQCQGQPPKYFVWSVCASWKRSVGLGPRPIVRVGNNPIAAGRGGQSPGVPEPDELRRL